MDLILWRHAEAEDFASSDLARPLTPRGERQAARMAHWLASRMGNATERARDWRIIASPATRAQQTANALSMPVDTIASLAPDTPAEAILRAADWPHNAKNIVVVGHQHTLGMVAGRLINGVEAYVSVKKGAIWWFRHSASDGAEKTALVAMATPDTIRE
ncbi:MAG: histidine phosphatase family protein [Usitatibacteraceae bacterium]